MSLSPDGDNPIRMVGDGTDLFIVMGGKTTLMRVVQLMV